MKSLMDNKQYVYCEVEEPNERKPCEEAQRILVREKASEYGIDVLTPPELINLLTGIDSFKLQGYIKKFGLRTLHHYTGIMNLTRKQEEKLKLIYKLVSFVNSSEVGTKVHIDSSQKAGELFQKLLSDYVVEVFMIACLNSRMGVIAVPIVCKGNISEARVYVRQVVKLALDHNAASVIAAHNHPAGSLLPSTPDKDLTRLLKEGLKTVEIPLTDHIIVSGNRHLSFAEQGLL